MHLEGSCHCGKVKFSVESAEPVPFMRCYCSICRKTAGAGDPCFDHYPDMSLEQWHRSKGLASAVGDPP